MQDKLKEYIENFKKLKSEDKNNALLFLLEKLRKPDNFFEKLYLIVNQEDMDESALETIYSIVIKNILLYKDWKKKEKLEEISKTQDKILEIRNAEKEDLENIDDMLNNI